MIKYLLFLLLSTSSVLLASDDLSSLLDDYEDKSQLHNKTKAESAGHLIIYSRDDLDKMKAYTLNDILKSTRSFSLQETSFGQTGLQRAGATCTYAGCVRLYINNQELSSITNASALMIFKNYDLSLIDHIELYISGNAFSFGNEYGFITIKLYTKTPSREKGTLITTSIDKDSNKKFNFLNAGILYNDYEYLLFGNTNKNTYDSIYNNNHEIKRFDDISNVYLTVSKKNDFNIELSKYKTNNDILTGAGVFNTPIDSYQEAIYSYFTYTKYYNNTKIEASYAKEENYTQSLDNGGIVLADNKGTINKMVQEFKNSVTKLSIQNNSIINNHSLLYGIDYQNKKLNLVRLEHDDSDLKDTFQSANQLKLYSVFLEDSYSINSDNIIIATGKYELYDHIGVDKKDEISQTRLGFVSLLNNNVTLKGFATDNYVYPSAKEFSLYSRVVDGNPDLKPIHVNNYSTELIYKKNKHKVNLLYMKMVIQDPIKINPQTMHYFTPANINAKFYDTSIDYQYKLNNNHKIKLQYYWTHHNRSFNASPLAGGFIQLSNSLGKFDFYNEIIYKKGYTSQKNIIIKNGYDYTSAITYKLSRALTVTLKGENLLNKAISSPVSGIEPVQTSQKQTNLRIEWFF